MYKNLFTQLLAEDAGNLAGLPKHVIKLAAERRGGRKSPVTVSNPTSHHGFKTTLTDALKSSKTVAIHANGEHVATVHTNDDYTHKQKYGLTYANGEKHGKVQTHYPKRSHYSNDSSYQHALRHHHEQPRRSRNTHFSKRDIIDHAHNALAMHTGTFDPKTHNYTVHAIGADHDRISKSQARSAEHQSRRADNKYRGDWHPSKDVGLAKNLDKAAEKMTVKRFSGSGATKKALDHHEHIGKLLKDGRHSDAIRAIDTLKQHISQANRDGHNAASVKSDIKDLKAGSYDRDYAVKRLRRMNESPELVSEVSKKMLARYAAKATDSLSARAEDRGYHSRGDGQSDYRLKHRARQDVRKREKGIKTAVKKLSESPELTKVKPT